MQAIARVLQDLLYTAPIKRLQVMAKKCADTRWCGSLLAGLQCIVLTNVISLQTRQRLLWLIQARSGHAPGPNGCPHQVHMLIGLR